MLGIIGVVQRGPPPNPCMALLKSQDSAHHKASRCAGPLYRSMTGERFRHEFLLAACLLGRIANRGP